MKQKTIKTLIVVILTIIAIASVFGFLKGVIYSEGASLYSNNLLSEDLKINISEKQMRNEYNNIYSVDYLQEFFVYDTSLTFEAISSAQIRGKDVTFTNYMEDNETTSYGNTCLENNIMAAIISGAGVESIGYRSPKWGGELPSGAQLAIWEFWNTWVENSGAKENGFEKGAGNGTVIEDELNGETERKKAQEFANKNTYNVNIYFLKYLTENNPTISEQIGISTDNQPNLILVEVLDEDGNIIEPDINVEENSGIFIDVTNYIEEDSVVKVGEEITYNINLYNKNQEEQKDLILKNILPEGTTLVKVVEVNNHNEIELNKNEDYSYNENTKELNVNIDKIDGMTIGKMTDQLTAQGLEYEQNGTRNYMITVRVDELEQGIYSKEIKNIVIVKKGNKVLAREETINIASDACLEVEAVKLPEKLNEKDECVIGLKITNKGLITAEDTNVKISVPEEILMKTYKISMLSDNEEKTEGTTPNVFEDNSIEIPEQETIYIELIGNVNEIKETKQITIEGTVNEEKVYWTTILQNLTDNI